MWTPYKRLQAVIETTVSNPNANLEEFERTLQEHRQNYLTLLKNPPKNEKHRQELNKGTVEGIDLPGMGHSKLPKELVAEAIILSDMYDLNEYMAFDLLGTAQQQMPNYPELPRGVVAVLLYYDGRKSLVTSLRTLVQARSGNLWTVEMAAPVAVNYINRYTNELVQDGIIAKILNLLEKLDTCKEIELLQRNRALGPPRYHQQVVDMYDSTKQCLAEIVFLYSAQTGLPKEPSFVLLNHLRNSKPHEDADGAIDNINLILLLAFLYTIDLSLLHKEDGEKLSASSDQITGVTAFNQGPCSSATGGKEWVSPGMRAVAQMGWAITLSNLRLAPQLVPHGITLENPDLVMEEAIKGNVFNFLYNTFLPNKILYEDVFMVRRIHNLLTDFISQMPHKVKEMRLRAEDTDRTIHAYMHEGLEPPTNLSHHFEQFLSTIAKLYEHDPLNLELAMDYWCPPEGIHVASFPYRAQPKKVSLYTFVVQTSEVLPSTLFVPYLKLLASLASCPGGAKQLIARLEFEELSSQSQFSFNLFSSWVCVYFNNLRQEVIQPSDTVYRVKSFPRGITPQELMGLQAVLDLIRTIAENDPSKGDQFCKSGWSAVTILLGLATCSVPIPLKATLISTLAGLARSPSAAAAIWHHIELSQIIPTVASINQFQPRSLQTELEEIECRNEEYPLTRSVLRLFNALTDKPIPKRLGASQRVPGFDPYLNFILNTVLLRFAGRSYKNSKEKWEVCEAAMCLVCKLLLQYDPSEDEFLIEKQVQAYNIGNASINPPPGYHLMVSLCTKSELLRLLFLLIEEGCRVFDSYTSFPGKDSLANSALYALKMIEHCLAIQHQFYSHLSNSNSGNVMLTGLSRLILGVSDTSGKPDHLLNIAKYVTYQSWLPRHALQAINILLLATAHQSSGPGHLLALFLSSPANKASIRHGFVSCLEAAEDMIEDSAEALDLPSTAEDEDDSKKKAVCHFLLQSLGQAPPNVAHYLFGFDITKEIRKTEFQRPGVKGMPRTCLHSILDLLNCHLDDPTENSGSVVELCYRLVYALAYNTKTSEPTLRYLRSCKDFLRRHLAALPFSNEPNCTEVKQMAWLLKAVAIELKVTAANNQLSVVSAMVETYTGIDRLRPSEQLVLRLVRLMKFAVEPLPLPRLEYFDSKFIDKTLKDCEMEEGRTKLVDIKAAHYVLTNELNMHSRNQSSTLGPRPSQNREIKSVLTYISQVNAETKIGQAMLKFLDGWRQATEVMFAVAGNALSQEKKFHLLVDIIHELLNKAIHTGIHPEIAKQVSGSILLLCVNLRQTFNEAPASEQDSQIYNFLDPNQYKLTNIMTNLLKWILASGIATEKLRANLFASLLNFLHLEREKKEKIGIEFEGLKGIGTCGTANISIATTNTSRRHRDSNVNNMNTMDFTNMSMDISTRNCYLFQMLALSCLDMLIELDVHPNLMWISALSSRGYLKFIIDSMLEADKHLMAVLASNAKTLRHLYVYESKMALLCRVASTRVGAEMLLEQNALACLSALHVYNKHPDISAAVAFHSAMEVDFAPDLTARYLQILSPALSMCDAIISSMGVDNHIAVVQVLKFLLSHGEMVTLVLRSGSPYHPYCYLKELAQLTGIIARATNIDIVTEVTEEGCDPGGILETTSLFNRVQRLMSSLVSRFVISESLLNEVERDMSLEVSDDPQLGARRVDTFLQIVSHLLLYVRNLICCEGKDRRASTVVFQPTLADISLPDRREILTMPEATLGVIVQQLGQAVQFHHRERLNLEQLIRKLHSVKDMSLNTVQQYVPETKTANIEECRSLAKKLFTEQIESKQTQLDYCVFIVEHCMYIIWAHLDYYMLRGLSNKVLDLPSSKSSSEYEYEVTWTVTADDLSHLKQGLLSVFNEAFCKSLLSIVKDMQRKDKGFIEALLTRIKKLIQFVPT
uniref:Uncharacterized protein n=1 Tax=Rhodnius prolixus TaxID=13249 RepID=T1HVP0_RHOPR